MSQADKLKEAFCRCQADFPFSDFVRLLGSLGYEAIKSKGSGGSRRRFVHTKTKHIVTLHDPGKSMGSGMVKEKRQDLIDAGTLVP